MPATQTNERSKVFFSNNLCPIGQVTEVYFIFYYSWVISGELLTHLRSERYFGGLIIDVID